MNTKTTTTRSRVPGFLLGRPRSQWKSPMVRYTPAELASVKVITIDDIMPNLTFGSDHELAA